VCSNRAAKVFSRGWPSNSRPPVYFLFVRFRGERIRFIRDYRYARYVFDEAQWACATEEP